ncbi:MAG: hypothetical protein FRX49_12788 [Trebouxia sp. A1-2]|nr:MAG: hypothetical protein FRX49_12788 [Trebouxia sp. A1-2]
MDSSQTTSSKTDESLTLTGQAKLKVHPSKRHFCKQSRAITSDASPLDPVVAVVLGVGVGVGRTMFSWAT